ncbi:hypothetical protein FDECE_13285 [Fusarium decemcellulare]|nr:hypothetical protein FDECE_13285 [Fusarium decemcellulare]
MKSKLRSLAFAFQIHKGRDSHMLCSALAPVAGRGMNPLSKLELANEAQPAQPATPTTPAPNIGSRDPAYISTSKDRPIQFTLHESVLKAVTAEDGAATGGRRHGVVS